MSTGCRIFVRATTVACLAALALQLGACDRAEQAGRPPAAREIAGIASAPRLVVLLIIDMFPADYLVRFDALFGDDGFRRLQREGAHFTRCHYPYALTETAPGNATIATGTTPDRHGIVSNGWFDPGLGRYSAAVEDAAFPLVGGTASILGASPHRLLGSTLGGELSRARGGRARVYGVAGKDRAAIFPAGHRAAGAFWSDRVTGRFMSSRYYGDRLPNWVEQFNVERSIARFDGRRWDVPGGGSLTLEMSPAGPDQAFFNRVAASPFFDEYLIEFARELITRESLGVDEVTDFIAIGLSGHDWLGHEVGPFDPSMADMARRTDARIARLLRFLDQRIGVGNYWLALTSDHGVVPTVKQGLARGLPSRNLDQEALRATMISALTERWGAGDWLHPTRYATRVRFNRVVLKKRGVTLADAVREAGDAARSVDGILGYKAGDLTDLEPAMAAAVDRSTYAGRSPDMLLLYEPYTLLTLGDRASHGTPHPYDTHVPLFLYGGVFRAGSYEQPCSPVDLAPTLAAALDIPPPSLASGRVLEEALLPQAPVARHAPTDDDR